MKEINNERKDACFVKKLVIKLLIVIKKKTTTSKLTSAINVAQNNTPIKNANKKLKKFLSFDASYVKNKVTSLKIVKKIKMVYIIEEEVVIFVVQINITRRIVKKCKQRVN